MPVYQLGHAGVPLSILQRDRLAKGITTIHHDETNAPEPFVRVIFEPLPYGAIYTAGEIAPSVLVSGLIRAGRSEVIRQRLVRRIYDLVSEVTKCPPDQIGVEVHELPSSWLMEAGFFLPEPTDEAETAWIKQLQETYPGQFDGWGGEGQHPALATVDDETRLAQLRHLAQRYLEVGKGQGHDVRAMLGQLGELVKSDPATSTSVVPKA